MHSETGKRLVTATMSGGPGRPAWSGSPEMVHRGHAGGSTPQRSWSARRLLRCVHHVPLLLVMMLAACAPAITPPAVPTAPAHPEFMFPAIPQTLRGTQAAERVERGWLYLQSDDLRSASREFSSALRTSPTFFPARTGDGYVALARRDYRDALGAFDEALTHASGYVPALVGRGQALLALRRDGDALAAFEAALAADPSLTDVERRVEVLRFRGLQDVIDSARRAAQTGRLQEARTGYLQALDASPESPFLYRELALVERRLGDPDAALVHLRRASELDPFDDESIVAVGEILEERGDFAGAEAAYRRAAGIESSADLNARIARIVERAREAELPAEFGAILQSRQITRGELAALIGVRLAPVVRAAPERQIVLTDTRDHWAADWIAAVARAGVIEPLPNHTFEPRSQVRRVDLAAAVSRLVTLLAARDQKLQIALSERPSISDVSATHLSYPEIAVAVASGVMPLFEGRLFDVTRAVTGTEAAEAIDRIRALAAAP
jgi:tetratricopeptide (TPR) repeat protein